MNENRTTDQVLGAAIEVHRFLGPGLLESIYEECMACELALRRVKSERQKAISLEYKGHIVGSDLLIGLLVEGSVVVELKSVDSLAPVHEAQLLTYLKLTGCRVGLLINFKVPVLKKGIRRMVHQFEDSASPRLCG
jgi:GxxExxY protein